MGQINSTKAEPNSAEADHQATASVYCVDDRNFVKYERSLLSHADLDFGTEILYFKVKTKKFEEKDVRIRTIIVSSKQVLNNPAVAKDVPILVFVHGYCGSGALFYKIFKHLARFCCLILVDLVGMGGSDHPNDFDRSTQDLEAVIEYFVEYLELWRQKISKSRLMREYACFRERTPGECMERFYLAGHSFGAYICAHYALKYPEKI